MMEKSLQLAESGEKVAYLLCYDTFDLAKSQHVKIKQTDHFLFQTLEERFRNTKVHLEFVSVRTVMGRVNQLIQEDVHMFVDEFSFEYNKFDPVIRREIISCTGKVKLPSVRFVRYN